MSNTIKATVRFRALDSLVSTATCYVTPGQGFKEIEIQVKEHLKPYHGDVFVLSIVFD